MRYDEAEANPPYKRPHEHDPSRLNREAEEAAEYMIFVGTALTLGGAIWALAAPADAAILALCGVLVVLGLASANIGKNLWKTTQDDARRRGIGRFL